MSKTKFESQWNVNTSFHGPFHALKTEHHAVAGTFRRRSFPQSRAHIERFFGDLSISVLSSMEADR